MERYIEFLTLSSSTSSFACLLSPLPLTLSKRMRSTKDKGKLDGRRYSALNRMIDPGIIIKTYTYYV